MLFASNLSKAFALAACLSLAACATNRTSGDPQLGFSITLGWQDACKLSNNCDPYYPQCLAVLSIKQDTATSLCQREFELRAPCIKASKSQEEAIACEPHKAPMLGKPGSAINLPNGI